MKTVAIIMGIVAISLMTTAVSCGDTIAWRQIYTNAKDLNQAGKSVDALQQATIALQEAEKRFGKNSLNTAKSLELIADISRSQGEYARAAKSYNRSLAIQEKIFGPSHPRVIKTTCALADLNVQQDRMFEARLLYEKARTTAEATNRADDLDTVAPLIGLAKLERLAGNYYECGELCRRIVGTCRNYVKYQPHLAEFISNSIQQLTEVSLLHRAKAQP